MLVRVKSKYIHLNRHTHMYIHMNMAWHTGGFEECSLDKTTKAAEAATAAIAVPQMTMEHAITR